MIKKKLYKFFGRIFSVDKKSTNRIIVYFGGFKLKILKPHLKRRKNELIALNCPITEIPPAEGIQREIQLANLKIMTVFAELCKKNNLEYWLDFGTLLGAVRHKGFIPWDDDIDVCMMRDDYEKFIKLFENGIPGYDNLFVKLACNGKNKCFVKIKYKKLEYLGIDVFPYDYYYKQVPDEEKPVVSEEISKVMNIWYYKCLRSIFKNKQQQMRNRFVRLRNERILKGHNLPDTTQKPALMYGIDFPHNHKNKVFDFDTIFPLKEISFEGIRFSCPNKPELLLEQIFGDYMSFPDDCFPRHSNSNLTQKKQKTILEEFINENGNNIRNI